MALNILLIEEDLDVVNSIMTALEARKHHVDVVMDGADGLFMSGRDCWDVVIVDRVLPNVDGLSIVRTMRRRELETPVLLLSAISSVAERVSGLEAGGDDCLTKPFAVEELQARVEALGRRRPSRNRTKLRVADLEVDLVVRTVHRMGRQIDLQHREFQLLECLMRHAGQVVTRRMLLETVWGFHFDPQTNVIETHISRLRGKIDAGFEYEMIQTIRGSGYLLRPPS